MQGWQELPPLHRDAFDRLLLAQASADSGPVRWMAAAGQASYAQPPSKRMLRSSQAERVIGALVEIRSMPVVA